MVKAAVRPNQSLEIDLGENTDFAESDAKLAEILTEFDSSPAENNYSVKVYRIPVRADGTGIRGLKAEYLFEGDHTIVPGIMEYCRDTPGYGTGTYRAIIRLNNAPWKQFDFRVFKPGAALSPVTPSNENNPLTPVVDRLMTRLDALENRLAERPQENTSELERLRTMAEILRPAQQPTQAEGTTIATALTMITTVLGITEKLRGDPAPAGGSSWADIGFKLAEGLSNGNIKLADLGTALTPAALANPRPAPAELPPPAPPNNARPVQVEQPSTSVAQRNAVPQNPLGIPGPMFQRLNECVITLCRRARKGDIPASAYVDFVLDEFDDLDSTGTLARSLVMDSGSLPLLEKTFPVMVPFHTWFEELLKECRNALNGPDGSTDDELLCEPSECLPCDGSPHDVAGQESGADAGDA